MIAIALCASRRAMTCALRDASGDIAVSPPDRHRGASLAAAVAELFERTGHDATQLGEVRVDIGPGSYTGLRVAVTYARFLARFAAAQLFAVTSFELIGARHARTIRVALDARRGRIHTAVVDRRPEIALAGEPCAVPQDAFVTAIEPGELVVADDSLHALLLPACERKGAMLAAVPEYAAADAFDPLLVPQPADVHRVEPLYLMGSYAE